MKWKCKLGLKQSLRSWYLQCGEFGEGGNVVLPRQWRNSDAAVYFYIVFSATHASRSRENGTWLPKI